MNVTKPLLLISGDRDSYSPIPDLTALVTKISAPKQLEVVSGADHFLYGQRRRGRPGRSLISSADLERRCRLLPQPNGWAHPTSHRLKRLLRILGQGGDGVQGAPQVVIVLLVYPLEDAQIFKIGQIVQNDRVVELDGGKVGGLRNSPGQLAKFCLELGEYVFSPGQLFRFGQGRVV